MMPKRFGEKLEQAIAQLKADFDETTIPVEHKENTVILNTDLINETARLLNSLSHAAALWQKQS